MEYIITRIRKILDSNNLTMYSYAKTTGIPQSSLYMMLHSQRKMTAKHFYTIVENLPLSIEEKKELTKRFQRTTMDSNRYKANSYIFDMIKDFSEYTFGVIEEGFFMPPVSTQSNMEPNSIYRGHNIKTIISQLLIGETSREGSTIYMYIPFEDTDIYSLISNTLKQYKTDINVVFMFDLLKGNIPEDSNRNLNILKNLVPLILADSNKFSFYNTYVDTIVNSSYLTPYPYFIAFTETVVFIDSNLDEIMVVNNKEIAYNIVDMCKNKLTNYRRFTAVDIGVASMVNNLVVNQGDITTHYCIEYEPCFSMHFTSEMIDAILPKEMPMRNELLQLLNTRLVQLKKINKSIQIFNSSSLMEFAKTGIIQEFPNGYSRPCNKKEKLHILSSLRDMAKSTNHIIRAINTYNMPISDCLSLIIQDKVFAQFSIWNDTKMSLKTFSINEASICNAFYNFINDLVDTNYVLTKNATLSYIDEAINYVKNSVY